MSISTDIVNGCAMTYLELKKPVTMNKIFSRY